MTTAFRALGLIIVLALVGGGYLTWRNGDRPQVIGSSDYLLPFESTEDWVTYSDHVVVAKLIGEKEIPPSQEEVDAGEGMVERRITLSVKEVAWSRPQAPAAPTEVTLQIDGWTFSGGDRREFRLEGQPELVRGRTYVFPVVLLGPEDGLSRTAWSELGPPSMMPFDTRLGEGSEVVGRGTAPEPVTRSRGKGVRELVTLLEQTQPDPYAAPYMGLAPSQRFLKASEARDAATP